MSTAAALYGTFGRLSARARDKGNAHELARIAATWTAGGGSLPRRMGLSPDTFRRMLRFHFPGARVPAAGQGCPPAARLDEIGDVYRLLMANRARRSASEVWIAWLLAVGCLGQNHLWQDLGLWNRAELSSLILRNFPALAARNKFDMKWKKFFYKQLCDMERIRACRAPSCQECSDYADCFGPEV